MATPRIEHRAKIAEARNVLGEVIARARFAGETTVLMNRGKEAAVLVGYDFYEQAKALAETVEQMRKVFETDTSVANTFRAHYPELYRAVVGDDS